MNQDSKTRATTAARMLTAAILRDDQNGFDFISDTITAEGLHGHFETEDGEPFETADEFLSSLMAETLGTPLDDTKTNRPAAWSPSAGGQNPARLWGAAFAQSPVTR